MDVRLYFYYEHSLTQSLCEGQSRLTRVLGGLAFLATWLCGLFWLVSAVKALTATGGQTKANLFNLVAAVFSVFVPMLATCAFLVEESEIIWVFFSWLFGMFAAMLWWWLFCFNISQCN
jgi:hypothetical protein